jgi:hypothetical protein
VYACEQQLVLVDADGDCCATFILEDDDPPHPRQSGLKDNPGWKLVSNLRLLGDINWHGTVQFQKNQIFLVKAMASRKGDYTDYIVLENDRDRQLKYMSPNNMYLIWHQNLQPKVNIIAAKLKRKEADERRKSALARRQEMKKNTRKPTKKK